MDALQISELRFRRLFESAQDGILLLNAETGIIEEINPYLVKLLGYTHEQIVGKALWDIGPFRDVPQARQAFVDLQRVGYIRYEHLPLQTASGTLVDVEFVSNRYDCGDFAVIQCNVRDITDRVHSAQALRHSLEQSIQAVALTLEMRDPYTAGHQRRVSLLAVELAQALNLSAEQTDGLRLAASIHDLGKIAVPAEILVKPATLTPLEMQMIQEHPAKGHEIIKHIVFPWPIAEIILQHHERIDGLGYPHGLRGEEILLEARILAVADSVEAMASHRPYRASMGLTYAINELQRLRGIAYDAHVVDACVRMLCEPTYTLPQ